MTSHRHAPLHLGLLAVLLGALVAWAGASFAAVRDHVAPRATAVPAAALADSAGRAFVTLFSGRDEAGRDLNLMAINLTNYGFIGNNFSARTPSMEYPVGTGHDHLVRGGLWVGAIAVDEDGVFTGVTAGAIDGSITMEPPAPPSSRRSATTWMCAHRSPTAGVTRLSR